MSFQPQGPIVRLHRNPWSEMIENTELWKMIRRAAIAADTELFRLLEAGEVEEGRDSFGAVLLDPTRPRTATSLADRLLASIELGPNGAKYIPNGAAKADAHDRHGIPNGELVGDFSHCLGNGEFAYGNSAEYQHAIGGGSGLSVEQDGALVLIMLKSYVDTIRDVRDMWIAQRRQLAGGHRWYNPGDQPASEYQDVLKASWIPIPPL